MSRNMESASGHDACAISHGMARTRTGQAIVAFGFFLLHLAAAALVPLVDDEAYYALWADWPSLTTYDHPPLVAWLIAPGKALVGWWGVEEASAPGRLVLRLPFVLLWAGAVFLAGRCGALASGEERVGLWSAIFTAVTVPWMVLGFVATPDGPLAFFWGATIWAVLAWRQDSRGGWLLLGGLFLALALLSKLTGAFLAFGVLLWLICTADGRLALCRPALWGGVALFALVLAPWVIWNAGHGWHGFIRQTSRLAAGDFSWRFVVEYILSQILLLTPLIAWLSLRGMARKLPARRHLLFFALPLPLFMLWHALKAQVLAHWLAPVYPAFAIFAAAEAVRRQPAWRIGAVAVALFLTILAASLAFRPGPPLFPGNNPPNQTKGWLGEAGAARAIAEVAERTDAHWIATNHYGLAGQLHHHLGARWPVWDVAAPYRYLFRPPFPPDLCDVPALLVVRNRISPDKLAALFERIQPAGEVVRRSNGAAVERYRLYRATGLKVPALCPERAGRPERRSEVH